MTSTPTRGTRLGSVALALCAGLASVLVAPAAANAAARGSATAWAPSSGTKARPTRWNPCRTIPYYVNPSGMPATGLADLSESLRRVSAASGLTFRYAGTQRTIPTPSYAGPAGGILVAWSTPLATQGLLNTNEAGYAGRLFQSRDGGGYKIVSGYVVFNRDTIRLTRMPSGFGPGVTQGLVLMHELGHEVGLGHVSDRWQIMNPYERQLPSAVWGAGDLTGLRAVGCL